MEGKVTKERLDFLEDRDEMLTALEHGGVDNWEWYGESLTKYNKEKDAREELESTINNLMDNISEVLIEGVEEPAGRGCGFGLREESNKAIRELVIKFIKENK